MIRRPPRSTHCISSAASDVYKRQVSTQSTWGNKFFLLPFNLFFLQNQSKKKRKMIRKFFIGGNWKSNNTVKQTKDLITKVYNKLVFDQTKMQVCCAPIFTQLEWVQKNVNKSIIVSSQNTSLYKQGAYTGEISPIHIKDMGIKWTILGHSERRTLFGENSEVVAKKCKLALDNGLDVIACVGEKLEERESGQTMEVVKGQLDAIKKILSKQEWMRLVLAYEPVWAIGTGKVATTEQAQEVHEQIRQYLGEVDEEVSQKVRIIYGGSVTDKNCGQLIQQKDIDGFLVGGASLKPAFADIVKICNKAEK
eukprot:TRINITY_DN728_c0_g1_i1.p1 TRINITY_DN728_c0_g1~~TRINITY_DN728_c0_g1_i1.p1  ORF type:complete len:308 (-),score=92.55 TRINITY_DN728_c0_g1_i1:173-1096(-)